MKITSLLVVTIHALFFFCSAANADSIYSADEIAGTFTIEEVDVKPVPIKQTPPRIKSADIPQGSRVVLAMVIGEKGGISSVRCLKSISPEVDSQVIKSVRRWKFRAAEHQGKPASVRLVIPIRLQA